KLASFFRSLSPEQILSLKAATGLSDQDFTDYSIHDRLTVMALLLKIFIEQIGIQIIKEADTTLGPTKADIYVQLAERVFQRSEYPTEIYTHYIYRRRGAPKTWLTFGDDLSADDISEILKLKMRSVIHYV